MNKNNEPSETHDVESYSKMRRYDCKSLVGSHHQFTGLLLSTHGFEEQSYAIIYTS